jgi:hypothetical protein
MRSRVSQPSDSADVYLVEDDFEELGIVYVECDRAEADRETIIRNFLSGEYNRPRRVVAFNIGEGWCRDVSEDIAVEVVERAFAADDHLPESTLDFVGRHTDGEKKPPAPSVSPADRNEGVAQQDRRRA